MDSRNYKANPSQFAGLLACLLACLLVACLAGLSNKTAGRGEGRLHRRRPRGAEQQQRCARRPGFWRTEEEEEDGGQLVF